MSLYCPLDRYYIDDLSDQLQTYVTDFDESDIADFLVNEVNVRNFDKVPSDLDYFTPGNSISGFEAFVYANELLLNGNVDMQEPVSQIGTGLVDIFLGGDGYLGSPPPAHYIIYKDCHDGDTCRVWEFQDSACRFESVEVPLRVSGIDAPEISGFKLTENVDKLYGEWMGNADLPEAVRKKIKKLISMQIVFTGKLATIIRNDLNTWNDSSGVPRLMEESAIHWTWQGEGDDTPPILCGTWQPFDMFGRRLGSLSQIYPSYLESYLKLRLADLMATDGTALYEEFLEKTGPLIEELRGINNKDVQVLLDILEGSLPRPKVMYSQQKCEELATVFYHLALANNEDYLRDDQLMQIITGSVYAYEKYRNQDGIVYQEANDLARLNGYGLWGEATFKTLYEINERDPRYHPPYCP